MHSTHPPRTDAQLDIERVEFEYRERRNRRKAKYDDWSEPAVGRRKTFVVSRLIWCFSCNAPRNRLTGHCTECGQSIRAWREENPDAPQYMEVENDRIG